MSEQDPDVFTRAAADFVDDEQRGGQRVQLTREQLIERFAEGMRGIVEVILRKIPPKIPESFAEIHKRWMEGKIEEISWRQAQVDVGWLAKHLSLARAEVGSLTKRNTEMLKANTRLRDEVETKERLRVDNLNRYLKAREETVASVATWLRALSEEGEHKTLALNQVALLKWCAEYLTSNEWVKLEEKNDGHE